MTTLLIASTGGHLTQLRKLLPRLRGIDTNVVWATPDGPQSRSLLSNHTVFPIRYTHPRDLFSTLWNVKAASNLLDYYDVSTAVSTGAAVAVSFFPLAASRGVSCHYIESATRVQGPSLTGNILRRTPSVHLYSQYESWATGPWIYRGSVFDGYEVLDQPAPVPVKRIVVSLGSIEKYGYRRLVERLISIIPPDVEVLWQTGSTDVTGIPIQANRQLPDAELRRAMAEADVVVCHSGTGSAVSALDAGRTPILLPRRPEFGEHVDGHQAEIARELEQRGLALNRDASSVSYDDLIRAAQLRVVTRLDPPDFALDCGQLGSAVRPNSRWTRLRDAV